MSLYNRWCVQRSDLIGITPKKAQDLIVQCFFEAQKETIARTSGMPDDAKVKLMVVEMVKKTLESLNESFENPSKQSLVKLLEALATKSKEWGTPQDIIMHHLLQIQDVMKALK